MTLTPTSRPTGRAILRPPGSGRRGQAGGRGAPRGRSASAGAPGRPAAGTVCESCRRHPATVFWAQPRAGAPFALCACCAGILPGGIR